MYICTMPDVLLLQFLTGIRKSLMVLSVCFMSTQPLLQFLTGSRFRVRMILTQWPIWKNTHFNSLQEARPFDVLTVKYDDGSRML